MSTSIFSSVRVEPCFYTGNVVHKAPYNAVLKQVENTGFTHKDFILVYTIIHLPKIIAETSFFIYSRYIHFTFGYQNRDAL